MGQPAGQEPDATPYTQPPPAGGPTVLRIVLGSQLRRLRTAMGISAEDAGYAIRASQSKISRMESGRIGFKQRDVADLLTLYGLTDAAERESMLAMARQSNAPGWWHSYSDVIPDGFHTYLGLEEAASFIRGFEALHVPSLLQTREYTHALGTPGRHSVPPIQRERHADFTARRQQLLHQPGAPRFWFVIDEAVLLRQVGDREIMRAQLEHLLEAGRRPNVTVQILPLTAPRRESGRFSILRFADSSLPDVVLVELLNQAVYMDKRADVDVYLEEFERVGVTAYDPQETQRVLREAIADLTG